MDGPRPAAGHLRAIERDSNDTAARTSLAVVLSDKSWDFINNSNPKSRDPALAVALASEAAQLAPDVGDFWNTIGAVFYRAGEWKAAVDALDKSVKSSNGGNGEDYFFLAMAHWQLGEKDMARDLYDRAVKWRRENETANQELSRLDVEAKKLMQSDPAAKDPNESRPD